MLGLVLVVTAFAGLLLTRFLYTLVRNGEFRVEVEDLAWFALAVAVATNFFGLASNSLYSPVTALSMVDGLLRGYNGLISVLVLSDEVVSLVVNVGLPIAEAINYVIAGSGFGLAIEVAIEVVEHLASLVIDYLVRVFSMAVEALWFIRYALLIGDALRPFMPYIAFFLVLPRVRNAAVVLAAVYLVLGLALPAAVNSSHPPPLINVVNDLPAVPNGLGFVRVEVVDELGRQVPAVLCIEGFGFPYNETVGLPNGVGVIALPMHVFRVGLLMYRVDCVVALFLRFSTNVLITPSPYLSGPVVIRLPMIAVFNGDSLVGLFNYTWVGEGSVKISTGPGYAVINVDTPCNGDLTVTAYAARVRLMPLGPVESNCSINYSITEGKPPNLVPRSWVEGVILEHELFCRDLELLINPSVTYQGPGAPPQFVDAVLSIIREACGGVGNYSAAIDGLRAIRLTASLTCRGTCNSTRIGVVVIGVEPYSLNYYALWSGTYVAWLNDSLMVIKNVESNPLNLGAFLALLVNAVYYSALFLGFVGLVALAPRFRYWSRLAGVLRVRPRITYGDVVSMASPLVSVAARRLVRWEDLVRRYYTVRRLLELSRRRYVRHALRAGYWVLRHLPEVSVAPYITLPTFYGVSLAREYLIRRVTTVGNEQLRDALLRVVSTTLSPIIVLRPYSVMRPLLRQGIGDLTRYVGVRARQAANVYSMLRDYLGPRIAFYVALRSVVRGVSDYLVSAMDDAWRALDKPLRALAIASARFGVLRLIDAESTELVIGELIRELTSKHGPLVDVKLVINNTVVKPSDVLKVDDYTDVTVEVGGESVVVKAWLVKELLRQGGIVSA